MSTIGFGSKLQYESAPATFTDIEGIDSISPSLGALGMVEATTHNSPDAAEEQIPGLLSWGEVSFEGNYTGHTSQVAMITTMHGRASEKFKVTFPASVTAGGKSIAFDGYVTKFDISAPTKDKLRFSGTIVVTTKPVLT